MPRPVHSRILPTPDIPGVGNMYLAARGIDPHTGKRTWPPSFRDYLLVRLLSKTGLRIGEFVGHGNLPGLKVNDVVFERKTLIIRGKGYASGRHEMEEQPIDNGTLADLKTYIDRNKLTGNDKIMDLSERHAERIIKRLAVRAGIPQAEYLTPHRLRAFFITEIAIRKPVAIAQGLARHKRAATTMHYVDLRKEVKDKAYRDVFDSPYREEEDDATTG